MSAIILTPKQKAKIKRAIKALNDVRQEIQQTNAECDINWYLEDNDNLNLMEDQPHDDRGEPQQDKVIMLFTLNQASGGGW